MEVCSRRTEKSEKLITTSKSDQLKDLIGKEIEMLRPGEPMMSMRDLCSRYGVSIYTAKMALNYYVEQGMLEHRQGSGTFRINPIEHDMAGIGVVAGHDFDPFLNNYFGIITKSVIENLNKSNLSTTLLGQAIALPLNSELLNYLRRRRIVGLILMGTFQKSFLDNIEKLKFPAVLSDKQDFQCNIDYAVMDDGEMCYALTEYLIGLGHKKIAFVSYPVGSMNRDEVVVECLKEYGVYDPELFYMAPNGDYWEGITAAYHLFEKKPAATAVFCKNDAIAVGMIMGLNTLGLKVPEDVSVVGLDGLPVGERTRPKLTTVAFDLAELGKSICELLVSRVRNPSIPQQAYTLKGRIVERESAM